MADTTIESALCTLAFIRASGNSGPFWIDPNTAAVVFLDSGQDLNARKTADAGASWGSQIEAETGTVARFACWFDRQTPGDTGTLVHCAWIDAADDEVKYASFDVSAGTWGTVRTIATSVTPATTTTTTGLQNNTITVQKTRSGNLIVCWAADVAATIGAARSTDGGANWSSIATPYESSQASQALAVLCSTGDDNDSAIIFWHRSADEISVKVYDQSGDSWTETSVATSMDYTLVGVMNMGVASRLSDSHVILAAWSEVDTATADLRVFDLFIDSVAAPDVTELTEILTNTQDAAQAAVFVNPSTDDIYVGYLTGSNFTATVGADYVVSTDGGSTWGSPVAFSEDADDDHRYISSGASGQTAGGRIQFIWIDDDDADLFTNANNDIELPPVIPGTGILTLPFPILTAAGTHTAGASGIGQLVLPFPVMSGVGLHTDIQGSGTLIVPFPILTGVGAVAVEGSGVLTLPFPVMTAAGEQTQIGTLGQLILPFPIVTASGQHLDIQGSGALVLPFPVLTADGLHTDIQGAAALVLPFPILTAEGRQIISGTGVLTLPFPILTAEGALIFPPFIYLDDILQLPKYVGVLEVPDYSYILNLPDYVQSLQVPDYSSILPLPRSDTVRSI